MVSSFWMGGRYVGVGDVWDGSRDDLRGQGPRERGRELGQRENFASFQGCDAARVEINGCGNLFGGEWASLHEKGINRCVAPSRGHFGILGEIFFKAIVFRAWQRTGMLSGKMPMT